MQHAGPFVIVGWKRRTSAPLELSPAVDLAASMPLPPSLQVGRPQVQEDATIDPEAADLALLGGRIMSPATSAAVAPPPAGTPPLPHYARERAPMAVQRNVSLRTGQAVAPAPIAYDVSVRPSAVDPSLLLPVPGAAAAGLPAAAPAVLSPVGGA